MKNYKNVKCPCCNKKLKIENNNNLNEGTINNYFDLINSKNNFINLVNICTECGYVELFDNGISDEIRNFVKSDKYKNILNKLYNNNNLEEGLKNWILLAILLEKDENYTEAGIAYCKVYDYLEFNSLPLDKRFIEKSASCFLEAASEYNSFTDGIFAVDALRRDGEFEKAKNFLNILKDTFTGEAVDSLIWKEEMWLELEETEKRLP